MKTAIKHENDKILVITLKHVSGRKVDINCLGTIKQWAIAHENGHKMRRLVHVSPTSIEYYGRCKSPGTPKQWEILMKTVIKRENDEFLVISIKHVTGLTCLENPLGTKKQWEITHKTSVKHENNKFLVITLKHVSVL